MKVGFICFHSFVNPGGVKNHILELSQEFEKGGLKQELLFQEESLKKNMVKT